MATSHISRLRSCPGPVSVPTVVKAAQTSSQTLRPLAPSDAIAGLELEVVDSDRNILFKHSSAPTCMALMADVVGGCRDKPPAGGKDSGVGCTRASSGCTRAGKKVADATPSADAASSMTISVSKSPSIASSSVVASVSTSNMIGIEFSVLPSSSSGPSPGTSGSGSGNVAQTPVIISRASWTERNFLSNRSSSTSLEDL